MKETNKLVFNLNATIKSLNETFEKQNKIIEEQAQEILRLKYDNKNMFVIQIPTNRDEVLYFLKIN